MRGKPPGNSPEPRKREQLHPDWWLCRTIRAAPVAPVRFSLGGTEPTVLPHSSFGSRDDVRQLRDYRELFSIGSSATGIR